MGSPIAARLAASPQWQDGRFRNRLPRRDRVSAATLAAFAFGGSPHRRPDTPVPVQPLVHQDFGPAATVGLRVVWLGHSTTVLELGGRRLLLDPVWGPRASPVPGFAARFYPSPLPFDELPPVDVVLISHDHYDHLDRRTIRALADRPVAWVTALGVGRHLVRWGVPRRAIREFDWWEQAEVAGLQVTATPARHFSGRGLAPDRTLWAGWSIAAPNARVYYSGDTAMQAEFAEIGARLGPFDLSMIEIGAYHGEWADVHLGPEQAMAAHRLVRARHLLPVHWGLFDLALHGWTEPIERLLASAAAHPEVSVLTPRPGEIVHLVADKPVHGWKRRWWPTLPWVRAEEAPVRSSS